VPLVRRRIQPKHFVLVLKTFMCEWKSVWWPMGYLYKSCQISLRATYHNGENIQNNHKIYQMTIKIKQTAIKYTNSFHFPSEMSPNLDFGFENIPSGNPGIYTIRQILVKFVGSDTTRCRTAQHKKIGSILFYVSCIRHLICF
jgi:hypothetical protein